MIEVKIKHKKAKNPVIGSSKELSDFIKIDDEKFYYNVVYDISEDFYEKHKSIFNKLN